MALLLIVGAHSLHIIALILSLDVTKGLEALQLDCMVLILDKMVIALIDEECATLA